MKSTLSAANKTKTTTKRFDKGIQIFSLIKKIHSNANRCLQNLASIQFESDIATESLETHCQLGHTLCFFRDLLQPRLLVEDPSCRMMAE